MADAVQDVLYDDSISNPVSPPYEPEKYEASSPTYEPEKYESSSPTYEPEKYEASSPTYQPEEYEVSSPTYDPKAQETPYDDKRTSSGYHRPYDADPQRYETGRNELPYEEPSRTKTTSDKHEMTGSRNRRLEHPRRGHRSSRGTDSIEIIRTLKRSRGLMSERRLAHLYPDVRIASVLMGCKNVRFSRDVDGTRCWEYESDHSVQDAVYDAVKDGLSRLNDIQRRVSRRFTVVRTALTALERSGTIRSSNSRDGPQSWTVRRRSGN
jgi:hypothetical protein